MVEAIKICGRTHRTKHRITHDFPDNSHEVDNESSGDKTRFFEMFVIRFFAVSPYLSIDGRKVAAAASEF